MKRNNVIKKSVRIIINVFCGLYYLHAVFAIFVFLMLGGWSYFDIHTVTLLVLDVILSYLLVAVIYKRKKKMHPKKEVLAFKIISLTIALVFCGNLIPFFLTRVIEGISNVNYSALMYSRQTAIFFVSLAIYICIILFLLYDYKEPLESK